MTSSESLRVCFCTHRLPYPAVSGGKREVLEMIDGLVEYGVDVTVVSFVGPDHEAAEMERALGCTVRPIPGLPDRNWKNVIRNLLSPDPLPVMKARNDAYLDAVRDQLDDADVVHLHELQISYLAAELPDDVPTVVRLANVKHEIYRQFARHTTHPGKAAYAYLQFLKTRRFETRLPGTTDRTLTITPEDRRRLLDNGATGRIKVVPASVDVSEYGPVDHDPVSMTVTFFGSMNYHPNEDAATWFADEVYPQLRDRFGDLQFEIVGKDPTAPVRALDDRDGITVTGFVDDLQSAVSRAAVVVLPIRVGTGVRMKALHAMAMGKPIVSTTVGIQGIEVDDGTHVSVADAPDDFAAAVRVLLTEPDRQHRYRKNARELVERAYTWDVITDRLVTQYREVLAADESVESHMTAEET